MFMWLKAILTLFWLVFLPFACGTLLLTVTKRKTMCFSLCMLCGYLVMFSVCEICFVPLILMKQPFHTAAYAMAGILCILALVSVFFCRKNLLFLLKDTYYELRSQSPLFYAALILILIQIFAYVFFMTIDQDDAFFVATAADAIQYDTMYQVEPYIGYRAYVLPYRYVLSPMPMFYAFLAKFTGFHAAVIAHTVLPVFLVSTAYMVYYLIAEQLFHGKKDSVGLFLVLLSVIHISSYYSVYTQGTFLLTRIWQGKAILAAILLPFLFYNCFMQHLPEREKGGWAVCLLTVLSCCMVSSMGIVLAPILCGLFAVLFGVFGRNWRYLLGSIICVLPSLVLALIYFCYF